MKFRLHPSFIGANNTFFTFFHDISLTSLTLPKHLDGDIWRPSLGFFQNFSLVLGINSVNENSPHFLVYIFCCEKVMPVKKYCVNVLAALSNCRYISSRTNISQTSTVWTICPFIHS